ncbi:MAG: hypothetical protein HQL82_05780 [Magnetococcales bacterium]|nr:hypothetical protein [Magnetococcales bacterium]
MPHLRSLVLLALLITVLFQTSAQASPASEAIAAQIKEKQLEFKLKQEAIRPLQKQFFELDNAVRSMERTLDHQRTPVKQALDKYRRVQSISLDFPEVATENERREYFTTKTKVDTETKPTADTLVTLREQLAQAYDRLSVAHRELDAMDRELNVLKDKLIQANAMIQLVGD